MELLLKIKIFYLKGTLWMLSWQLFFCTKGRDTTHEMGPLLLVSDKSQVRTNL